MKRIAFILVRLIQVAKRAYAKKWSFVGFFLVVSFFFVFVLAKADLLPDAKTADAKATEVVPEVTVYATHTQTPSHIVLEEPVKIEIPKISLSVTIASPTSTDLEVLDEALLKGAVRYPTSAKLGETGNVVLFGHSSYLPVVGNPAYKTFDGIQKLTAGDVITVYSSDIAYTYIVRTMEKMSAKSDAGIALGVAGKVLTLSTCNSFGEKSDRFVVTADFVESHTISS